ncbi:aldehyde dehydrogenase family protein [Sinorhizobium prairiense]|uniref:aldehyde dehydrogenase family protein n=1 Tax=unclassified Sinorhizobium TaxID=2613772 RepID=UPI0023D876A3|nr:MULTISPECIES: aldehyde dehydrogenase family protein [unclassified Sinorhizobium]WEJ08607.1 aldehyde dehydrogenase family protein [Sinorhizobium sp. M103]WEJ13892.1 aldehyde dehydrogenase family protein [Sinorhizobium sp. K101]WEJ35490.1 aldehyde dehydrogenase family protein [Sinorhizobium sp. C101]
MQHEKEHYVNGSWVDPIEPVMLPVVDPSTETTLTWIAGGGSHDVERAVAAARAAFPLYSGTSKRDRTELLSNILHEYRRRKDDIVDVLCREMGAPLQVARDWHDASAEIEKTIEILQSYDFEETQGFDSILREPIGVVGMITPWNWPVGQIITKVAPALAAGCTMVLKPSEMAPLCAIIFSEIIDASGVPAGVYNMIQGQGAVVGEALSAHPGVDMMSFTGSTAAGIRIAQTAARTVKRVSQELGGKSANILLPDVDLEWAVSNGVHRVMRNSGQACSAPTRMLVPAKFHDDAKAIAKNTAESLRVGDVSDPETSLGPVSTKAQFDKVQHLIRSGIEEGAELVTGGLGRPSGRSSGYFVKPTVFAGVNNRMKIAREEVFGPVLTIIPYSDEDEAVEIANDTVYGLAGYVASSSLDRARRVAGRLRAGMIHINYPIRDAARPFGGYKQSGNGRENGKIGLEEYLEVKAVLGSNPAE